MLLCYFKIKLQIFFSGIFFVLFFVPETKGKTSEEIQNLFCKVPIKQEKVTEKEAV